MREIEFRAWSHIVDGFVEPFMVQHDGYVLGPSGRVELMQYTGLKDKNGKEIYEGDILGDGSKYVAEVVYFQGEARFGFSIDKEQEPSILYGGSMLTCEVIGNIWENPELIK